jgi:hypothetical protein
VSAIVKMREEPEPLPSPAFAFEALREMAHAMAKSGLLPGVTTPDAALALILLCQSEGLHPGAALRRYHIVKGRPSMRADAMHAEFQARGGIVRWLQSDDRVCRALFIHPIHAPDGLEIEWTLEKAQAAKLDSEMWRKYPAAMLRARAISEGVRAVLPGVVAGIYTPEEASDFDSPPNPPHVRTVQPTAVLDAPRPAPAKDVRERWAAYLGKLLKRWREAEPLPDDPEKAVAENTAREHRIVNGLVSDAITEGRIEPETVAPGGKRNPRLVWEAVHDLCEQDFEWVKHATAEHLKKHVQPPPREPAGDPLDAPDGDPEFATDGKGDAYEGES